MVDTWLIYGKIYGKTYGKIYGKLYEKLCGEYMVNIWLIHGFWGFSSMEVPQKMLAF